MGRSEQLESEIKKALIQLRFEDPTLLKNNLDFEPFISDSLSQEPVVNTNPYNTDDLKSKSYQLDYQPVKGLDYPTVVMNLSSLLRCQERQDDDFCRLVHFTIQRYLLQKDCFRMFRADLCFI